MVTIDSFNQVLKELELEAIKLYATFKDEPASLAAAQSPSGSGLDIANRAISRLIYEICNANKILQVTTVLTCEQNKAQDELTHIAKQVFHDISSPLAILEAMIQSPALVLREKSKIIVSNAISTIRNVAYTLVSNSS